MKNLILIILLSMLSIQCQQNGQIISDVINNIPEQSVDKVIKNLTDKFGDKYSFRIERGVKQVASFWEEKDGTVEEFEEFCTKNFICDDEELNIVYKKIERNFEIISGNFHRIDVDLKVPLHLKYGDIHQVDMMFAGYSVSANLNDDFFNNKIAFYLTLNFPFYSLKEKAELGPKWTRREWAYARMGDVYTSRVPAELKQNLSKVLTNAATYISEYNICMGNLIDDKHITYFPEDLKLISHWGLRDELKSNYFGDDGLKKQKMIYEVMKNIISQEIPKKVINSKDYYWNPTTNQLFDNDKEIKFAPEINTRYQYLLNNFLAVKKIDKYSPRYPNFIMRTFDKDMEISQEEVEQLFIELLSSPEVKDVANLISKRIKRDLEPFDIWYDGFKSRSTISEKKLDVLVAEKYPDISDFQADLVNILKKLKFSNEKAEFISSRVSVDPARGSGHAWGAAMKSDIAHLRTKFPDTGMNYKGYNIAMHEFGHNVEQTITLQDVDYYMLNGVPNTAFTEALAFIFQERDLEMLDIKDDNKLKKHYFALDNFWSCYEMMGVSLIDMNVWKWMYNNSDATAEELKFAVIKISKDIWNKYYAEVFGIKDQTILAIYSHMIEYPLYLSAYPIGSLIQFQIEEYITDKNFAHEIQRIYECGKIIPQEWMKNAVDKKLSNKSLLNATKEALDYIK
ncbi:MAG: hypothetical protein KAT68_02955 [Bacteroidales bacterium]|nr:hypothetical protein [Bacteroidales bacterium]